MRHAAIHALPVLTSCCCCCRCTHTTRNKINCQSGTTSTMGSFRSLTSGIKLGQVRQSLGLPTLHLAPTPCLRGRPALARFFVQGRTQILRNVLVIKRDVLLAAIKNHDECDEMPTTVKVQRCPTRQANACSLPAAQVITPRIHSPLVGNPTSRGTPKNA